MSAPRTLSELRDQGLVYAGIILGALLSVVLTVVYGAAIALALVIGASLFGLLRTRSRVKRAQR